MRVIGIKSSCCSKDVVRLTPSMEKKVKKERLLYMCQGCCKACEHFYCVEMEVGELEEIRKHVPWIYVKPLALKDK